MTLSSRHRIRTRDIDPCCFNVGPALGQCLVFAGVAAWLAVHSGALGTLLSQVKPIFTHSRNRIQRTRGYEKLAYPGITTASGPIHSLQNSIEKNGAYVKL